MRKRKTVRLIEVDYNRKIGRDRDKEREEADAGLSKFGITANKIKQLVRGAAPREMHSLCVID